MIGADPEFALLLDEKIIPAAGVGGTKEAPIEIPGYSGYSYHEDNVSVEVSIPPASNPSDFEYNIARAISITTREIARKLGVDQDRVQLKGWDSHRFERSELTYKAAQEFGCDPDFDGYAGGKERKNPPPFGNWRFFGGHIHIDGPFNCPPFVAACFADLFISCRLQTLDCMNTRSMRESPDDAHNRAWWYGMPGVYREKPYGIEYRTLSSWWCNSADGQYYVAQLAQRLREFLKENNARTIKEHLGNVDWLLVREAVVTKDYKMCSRAIRQADKVGVKL